MQKNAPHFWEAGWLILEQPGIWFGCQSTVWNGDAVVVAKFTKQVREALVEVRKGECLALGGYLH